MAILRRDFATMVFVPKAGFERLWLIYCATPPALGQHSRRIKGSCWWHHAAYWASSPTVMLSARGGRPCAVRQACVPRRLRGAVDGRVRMQGQTSPGLLATQPGRPTSPLVGGAAAPPQRPSIPPPPRSGSVLNKANRLVSAVNTNGRRAQRLNLR